MTWNYAYGINNDGWVTGQDSSNRAFLTGGDPAQCNTLGWTFSTGQGINNHNWVTGNGRNPLFQSRAFRYDGTEMRDLGTLGNYQLWAGHQ